MMATNPTSTEAMDLFWSVLLPDPAHRPRFTWVTAPLVLLGSVPLILTSHLRLRYPNTPLVLRVPLAIVAIWSTLNLTVARFADFTITLSDGDQTTGVALNFVLGVAAAVWTMLIVELLFCGQESDFDVLGVEAWRKWCKEERNGHGHAGPEGYSLQRPRCFPGTIMPLELDLLASIRGLGYGRGADQPGSAYKPGYEAWIEAQKLAKRPNEEAKAIKWRSVRNATRVGLQAYLALDLVESFYRDPNIIPTVRRYAPSSIDDAAQGRLGIYGPWIVTVLLCIFIISVMQTTSTFYYLLHLLPTRPADVPIVISRFEPLLFYRPHLSTSIREFWGQHWHTLFRRIFVVFGYRPASKVAKWLRLPRKVVKAAGVMGAFFVSSMLHEMCLESALAHFQNWDPEAMPKSQSLRTPSRGFGARRFLTSQFFMAQGVAIIVEDIWTSAVEPWLASLLLPQGSSKDKTASKGPRQLIQGRPRAVLGWMWTMSLLVLLGHDLLDSWMGHGVAATVLSFRLTQPLVHRFITYLPQL